MAINETPGNASVCTDDLAWSNLGEVEYTISTNTTGEDLFVFNDLPVSVTPLALMAREWNVPIGHLAKSNELWICIEKAMDDLQSGHDLELSTRLSDTKAFCDYVWVIFTSEWDCDPEEWFREYDWVLSWSRPYSWYRYCKHLVWKIKQAFRKHNP